MQRSHRLQGERQRWRPCGTGETSDVSGTWACTMSVAGSTLYVHGELDTAAAAALTDAAVRVDVDELDLAAVTFIDAGGLAAVLAAVVDDETGPGLRLREVSGAVIRLLDVCDLVDVAGLAGIALGQR